MAGEAEIVDAKIAASEARLRGEVGIAHAELLARMDLHAANFNAALATVSAKLSHIEDQNRSTRANVWSAAAFVVGSMIATIALLTTVATDTFDRGAALHDRIADEIGQQLRHR